MPRPRSVPPRELPQLSPDEIRELPKAAAPVARVLRTILELNTRLAESLHELERLIPSGESLDTLLAQYEALPQAYSKAEALVWDKVQVTPNHWLWTSATSREGRGVKSWEGKIHYAHRIVWELSHRRQLGPLKLYPLCAIKNCVRPTHWRVGEYGEAAQLDTLPSLIQGETPPPLLSPALLGPSAALPRAATQLQQHFCKQGHHMKWYARGGRYICDECRRLYQQQRRGSTLGPHTPPEKLHEIRQDMLSRVTAPAPYDPIDFDDIVAEAEREQQ